jgi:uncharacterized membrane protein YdjX (TVP38/TMEM64 family)
MVLRLITTAVHFRPFVLAAFSTWIITAVLAVTVTHATVAAATSVGEIVVRGSRSRRLLFFWLVTTVVHFRPFILAALSTRIKPAVLTVAVTRATVAAASSFREIVPRSRSRAGITGSVRLCSSKQGKKRCHEDDNVGDFA